MRDLTPKMRLALRKHLSKEAPRVLKPLVLDIITSPQMLKDYPPPTNVSEKLIDVLYKLEMVGTGDDEAHLVPMQGTDGDNIGTIIIMKKVNGRWMIHRLPSLER